MSLNDCRGSAWATRELMRRAQADINSGGEIRAAVVKYRQPHPAKTLIGTFKSRLLRLRRRASA